MNRLTIQSNFKIAFACATFCLLSLASANAADKPNVVLILCDDIRWDAMSCAGHPHLKTPHIDSIAKEGVFFENAFCTTSLCSPSRASILSGLYAHSHGVTNNFTEYPEQLNSFPLQLQKAGYETAYVGKYHMGQESDSPRPGFDYFVTHKGQGKYFDNEFNFNGKERKTIKGYYTHTVTDMAIDWMNQDRDKPFMLMIGQKAPHSFYFPEEKYANAFDDVEVNYPHTAFNLDGKPEWIKQRLSTWHGIYGPLFDWRKEFPDTSAAAVKDFEKMVRAYWGTILSIDDSVGKLKAYLAEKKMLDNTVFIFMGDNGLLEGEHGMVDKRTMHEASIRIPIIVRYPKLVAPEKGKRVKEQVLTVDIAPSILEMCGAEPLKKIHGSSFKTLITDGDDSWRDGWVYHYNYEKQFPYTPNVRGIRTNKWKYIHYPHGDGSPDRHMAELYDMENDLGERNNLIKDPSKSSLIAKLKTDLKTELKRVGLERDSMPLDEGVQQKLPEKSIR